jgi:hypothetical protein
MKSNIKKNELLRVQQAALKRTVIEGQEIFKAAAMINLYESGRIKNGKREIVKCWVNKEGWLEFELVPAIPEHQEKSCKYEVVDHDEIIAAIRLYNECKTVEARDTVVSFYDFVNTCFAQDETCPIGREQCDGCKGNIGCWHRSDPEFCDPLYIDTAHKPVKGYVGDYWK